MTMFKTGAFAALVTLGSILQPAVWADEYNEGYIRFSNDELGSKSCSLKYVTAAYEFVGEEPDVCINDEMSYFRLDNAPSASQFVLEEKSCHDSGGWVIVLSVYKHPTTTGWISIPSLKQYAPGNIIVAGVKLKEIKEVNGDDLKGQLSCVRVRLSPRP